MRQEPAMMAVSRWCFRHWCHEWSTIPQMGPSWEVVRHATCTATKLGQRNFPKSLFKIYSKSIQSFSRSVLTCFTVKLLAVRVPGACGACPSLAGLKVGASWSPMRTMLGISWELGHWGENRQTRRAHAEDVGWGKVAVADTGTRNYEYMYMYTYMTVYVYVYAYICIRICICIRTRIRIGIGIGIRIGIGICIYVYTYTYRCMYTYTYANLYMYTYTYANLYMYMLWGAANQLMKAFLFGPHA